MKWLSLVPIAVLLSSVSQCASGEACLADPVDIPKNIVTSPFGVLRCLKSYHGECHTHWGVDFHARLSGQTGANLKAVATSTVLGAGFWGSGYGNRVVLRLDNGDTVIYSHMEKINPAIKSGGSAVGFRGDAGAVNAPGTTRVNVGDIIGVAGGTASHAHTSDEPGHLPIHMHLEYTTGYGGYQLRQMGGGSDDVKTRSRYYRDVRKYMCKTYAHAPDAGPVVAGTGGSAPAPTPANPQSDSAQAVQPNVLQDDHYGVPDTPPYADYEGMSEQQIVDAETTRRMLDTEWETGLIKMSSRGLWMEISRMEGVRVWLKNTLAERRAHIESMYAALLAQEVNQ